MSVFKYHKPGIGNASSYIVSGVPWYTSSLAPALSTTSKVVNFPRVTNYVVVKNNSTTDDTLRFTFNNDNIVDNTNYITLEGGESFSGELRTTDVHFISDTETPVPFTVVAGLTNIERQEMTQTTPTAPNLLAWVQKQKLTHDDLDGIGDGDFLGWISGAKFSLDTTKIFVAALLSDDDLGNSGTGGVFYFEKNGDSFQQKQKIFSEEAGVFSLEGYATAYSDQKDILAISNFSDDVYLFAYNGNEYQQVQKLTASGDLNPDGDSFGNQIVFSLDGNILAIGSQDDEENGDPEAGSVYIFQSSSLGYQQVQKLTASGDADPIADKFGNNISLNSSGDILVISAPNDDENGGSNDIFSGAGSVYIFQSSSIGYQQVQKLTASGDLNPAEDYFGVSTSISSTGDILAIGAYYDDENGAAGGAGSVYLFQSSSVGYQQVQKLTGSGGGDPSLDRFGVSVSLNPSGDILVIGAQDDEDDNFSGTAYIFESSSSGFVQTEKLKANEPVDTSADYFGQAVSINSLGDTIAVAAYQNDENGPNAGAVYIFKYTRDY
jgi:hypothetical protein